MIFSLPFIVVSVFASLAKLALSLFIGAILAFYVKYSGDEYASSIRWSRTGGLLEMIQLLWCSNRFVPRMSNAVLVSAIAVSFFTLYVSIIITTMVSRTDMEGSSTVTKAFTTQLISMDPSFWTVYLRPKFTVEEALTAMLNDTRLNPNPNPRTRYTPRSFAYEDGCDESTVLITKNFTATIRVPSKTTKCKAYILAIFGTNFDWEPKTVSLRTIDSSTFMAIAAPFAKGNDTQAIETIEPYLIATRGNFNPMCARITISNRARDISLDFPKDGMIALPKTHATKCQYGTNGSLVSSATFFLFAVGHMQDFDNITATILDDPTSLPLLKPMNTAINEGAFTSPTNSSTLVMFTKIPSTTPDVHFFTCMSKYREEQGEMGLLCTYMLISFIIVNPQAVDPIIAADLNPDLEPLNFNNATNQLDFTILHLPQAPESEKSLKTTPLFSSAHLIKATADATRYLASLGHNVHMYKEPGSMVDHLYILYDAVELKDAYEISTAALAVVCALSGLFGLLWVFSEKILPTVYNSTLQKTIYKELNSKDESVPMLMSFTHDPLAFDGNQVVPNLNDQLAIAHETSSEDHPMVSLQCRNNVPDQQRERQPLMPLDETPAQFPLMSSWSITASTPILNPTRATTTATAATRNSTSRPLQTTQLQPHSSANLGVPPPIPARPRFANVTPPTFSVYVRPYNFSLHVIRLCFKEESNLDRENAMELSRDIETKFETVIRFDNCLPGIKSLLIGLRILSNSP
ncbi:hypothetical protein BGZ82_002388 [Podila clonocystis]|nr:hypothetical protein BGZ82_002388 [Podila clonocystis]